MCLFFIEKMALNLLLEHGILFHRERKRQIKRSCVARLCESDVLWTNSADCPSVITPTWTVAKRPFRGEPISLQSHGVCCVNDIPQPDSKSTKSVAVDAS